MLDSAPVPPPVTKAAPPPPSAGMDAPQTQGTFAMENGNGHGGMEVDHPMVAS